MPTIRTSIRLTGIVAAALALIGTPLRADDSSAIEKEQLAILRSDAPTADKALACKHLAIYGSSEAVADLAKLLSNPQLASWARIALEAIPSPAADDALRKAAESLDGLLLVGTINSIGVRRDASAVDLLAPRLSDKDGEVASAAAVALGRIGNASAEKPLRQALSTTNGKVRSAVAEGCVLVAERLYADGKPAEAVDLYDLIRKSDVPKQRILEATRGAILARGQDGIPLLLEQFRARDPRLFQIALSTAREFPGGEVDQALAAELTRTTPDRAALIVVAMADRPATVVLPAVLQAATQGPKPVRLAAIAALARVGNVACLQQLLDVALESDAEIAKAARSTLADLPGDEVNSQIAALLPKAKGPTYLLLIELVGQRRIEAIADLLKALDHSDKSVRSAALIALGETVSLKQLNVLIAQAVSSKREDDAAIVMQALKSASIRMPEREECAIELTAAYERAATVTAKGSLLQILGAMGGTRALATVGAAGKGIDPQLQDISSRLLGEWMTADAAPVLLDLSKAPANQYRVRALRGYIRIARQFVLPEDQRLEMCQKAFDASHQVAERKLVLDVLRRYPSLGGLKLAIKAMQEPDLKDDATGATLFIAQKLGGKADVGELLAKAGLEKVKLEIVKAEYGLGTTQKDVTAVLKKSAGDLPVITLTSGSFNAAFGDPVPNAIKQLKVQYKINGKAGEATFPEDAVIVLPMPK
jgi:HEAT repeat protein